MLPSCMYGAVRTISRSVGRLEAAAVRTVARDGVSADVRRTNRDASVVESFVREGRAGMAVGAAALAQEQCAAAALGPGEVRCLTAT